MFALEKNEHGFFNGISYKGYRIIHLNPGSERNQLYAQWLVDQCNGINSPLPYDATRHKLQFMQNKEEKDLGGLESKDVRIKLNYVEKTLKQLIAKLYSKKFELSEEIKTNLLITRFLIEDCAVLGDKIKELMNEETNDG